MKLRKSFLTLLMTIATIIVAGIFNASYAAIGSMHLDIKMLRRSGYGYQALEKNIWKIVETNAEATTWNYDKTIYCLKGGPGFGSNVFGSGTTTAREYTRYYDMKDPGSIPEPYSNALPDVTSPKYKSLLWLLDSVYVAPKVNASTDEIQMAEQYRNLLLTNAGIPDSYLTDDDIDAVQQLAVWHFTNDDAYKIPDGGTFEFWINANQGSDANYNPMSDEVNENGWERADECKKLYNYLVNTATEMGTKYQIKTASRPYSLEQTTKTQKTKGNNYIIGPFKINKISDTEATLTGTFKNGENVINPTLIDADGNEFATLNDTIGKEFYISIPDTTTIEKITFEINVTYYSTTITYWSVKDAPEDDQPVAVVERQKVDYSDNTEYTPVVKEEKFDLALRKFIVSIGGVAPEVNREPQISEEALQGLNQGSTTAEKVHPKNPLVVKTGDKVVYTIRVYNEGEVNGYVKEITDYLPEGLKLAENSDINTQNGWKSKSDDEKAIVTDKLAGTLLEAFDGTTLKYLDVQIECEVTATVQSKDTILKNIAEITAHSDESGNTQVIDRDSTPNNVDSSKYGTTSQEDDDDFEQLIIIGKYFDLALRKFIVSIGGVAPEVNREPQISEEALQGLNQGSTTAEKVHPKNPLMVKTGDKVVYTIRVYNEGEVNGYVNEITDYLPEGLTLAENSDINTQNGWKSKLDNEKAIVTDKLAGTLLEAFDGTTLKYLDVQIECEVTATVQSKDTILKNIAEITAHSDESGNTQVIDRDSTPNNVDSSKYGTTSQEDDDDFEQLIIIGKYFDLSLRKFIEGVDDTALSNGDGRKIREPVVDVLPLLNGEKTATYNHPKEPVQVDVGDEVTYVIRVYNEGQIDGYVNEITDYLPQYLEFINNEFNASYGWRVSDDGRTVKTTITSPDTEYSASRDELYENRTDGNDKVLLKAFDTTAKKLDYIDVKIRCKVKNTGVAEKITNIAEITKATDNTGNEVTDRDSKPGDLTLPADSVLPSYKDEEIAREDEYIPGQEDDDDFEKIIVQKFDLSLRKFITGVNDKEVTSRIPVFSKNEEGKYTYTHPKTPVEVASGDIVIYTLRVYNEGNQAGYAKEVKDDIPEGLEFLPDNAINKEYRWKLYKEDGTETTSVEEAKTIRTDYLSKEQETATGRDNLLDAFNTIKMTQPDFRDLKIAFKVTEPNTSDRIIINTAEISEDSDEKGEKVDDIDSIPDNNKEGEDDIDIEKVKVKYFDLALEKIITEYSIKLDGKTTVTKTNHKFGVKPEPVVKIELKNYTIKNAVIKYKYQIKITNEGEMAGYAEEVKDYIPEGLKFVQAENPKWKLGKDGKTVTTDQLKDTLLQPGESAVVEITLQWINGQHNLGLKQNWAEISEDKDEHKNPVDDIDSTPNNRKEGEDDIDDASVVLSITTGIGENYVVITGGVLAIICAGIVLIRKLVI